VVASCGSFRARTTHRLIAGRAVEYRHGVRASSPLERPRPHGRAALGLGLGLAWSVLALVACRSRSERAQVEQHVGSAASPGAIAVPLVPSALAPSASSAVVSSPFPAPPASASASASVHAGASPALLEDGPGLWIWDFEKNAPTPERAAILAVKRGIKRVFIKSGNGAEPTRWARNFHPRNLEPFLTRGIEVWGFGYFYPGNSPDADGRRWGTLEAQAETTARITLQTGVTGLVVDAEIEFENKRAEAAELCRLLRARLGPLKLAYTTFGWLSLHPNFPFEELEAGCGDAFLPQVYWAFGWPGGVRDSLARLDRDVKKRGLRAPLWPVQSNERDPAVADLNEFFRLAGPNASVFYLHPEDSPQTQKLGAVHFRGSPSAKERKLVYEDFRRRQAKEESGKRGDWAKPPRSLESRRPFSEERSGARRC
jgi:hypothetical protein